MSSRGSLVDAERSPSVSPIWDIGDGRPELLPCIVNVVPLYTWPCPGLPNYRQCLILKELIFIARAYACRARYCFTNSVCLSVQCRYCVKTNGHIDTLSDSLVGRHSSFSDPMAITKFQSNPSLGALNAKGWENLANIAIYLWNGMCHPVSRLPGRQNLRSANSGQLDVPRAALSSCGVRAFANAGPSLWNTLPVHLKNRNLTLTTFMRHLKSYLFSQYWFRIERVWGVIT